MKDNYLFVDIESTGLNYKENKINENKILEFSWLLTDENLKIINKGAEIIKREINEIEHLLTKETLKMHRENQLLKECNNSLTTIELLDELLFEIIADFCENKKIILAGSNPNFDVELIRREMPKLFSLLHYRLLDVNSVKTVTKVLYGNYNYSKTYSHRAKKDIEESYNELLFYMNLLENGEKNVRKYH